MVEKIKLEVTKEELDAISFVNDLGVDFFLENTCFGVKLKEIVFKLSN